MNISDVIQALIEFQKEYGDLPVWVHHEWAAPIEKIYYFPGQDRYKPKGKDYIPEIVIIE